jgi:hypothetical protein
VTDVLFLRCMQVLPILDRLLVMIGPLLVCQRGATAL